MIEDVARRPKENVIILPKPKKGQNMNQFTLRIRGAKQTSSRRDEFRAFLTERRIGNEVYYPKTLHTQEWFSETGQRDERLPRAEALARESVSKIGRASCRERGCGRGGGGAS